MKQLITLKRLKRAISDVTKELEDFGLWTDDVAAFEVLLEPLAFTYYGICYASGTIRIPAVSGVRFRDWVLRRTPCPLRDVLRHEYAHVIAHVHCDVVYIDRFREVFGRSSKPYSRETHVSSYAATNRHEDFAETFMLFVKHKGRLPRRFDLPVIRRKWEFVVELVGRF